jgi:hypothetical protein
MTFFPKLIVVVAFFKYAEIVVVSIQLTLIVLVQWIIQGSLKSPICMFTASLKQNVFAFGSSTTS